MVLYPRSFTNMKLRLTKKEIKAVEESIEHWKKDIRERLVVGDIIIIIHGFPIYWKSDNTEVKMYDDSCALCLLTAKNNGYRVCTCCPYYKKYKTFCHTTPGRGWGDFFTTP